MGDGARDQKGVIRTMRKIKGKSQLWTLTMKEKSRDMFFISAGHLTRARLQPKGHIPAL